MNLELKAISDQLWLWCRQHHFAGFDPFDALNSRVFSSTPLKRAHLARLAWTQINKRSPVNLRNLALVPPQQNPKGIALFALAALAHFRRLRTKEAEQQVRELLRVLMSLRSYNCSGAAWGYNFDWQSRNFFAARGTAAIVPTGFAARAFVEATEAFEDVEYSQIARSICDFIINDLPRSVETDQEICFGYTPQGRTLIYNASLLAGEVLAAVGSLTGDQQLSKLAEATARYVINQQRPDGSWFYGAQADQSWIDNFHTAFLLDSLSRILRSSKIEDRKFHEAIGRGYKYWSEVFFLADGQPKYYHDSLYPADSHAAGTAIATFVQLKEVDPAALMLAEKTALWTAHNLRDRRGFFYYQRRRFYTVRTPFMRWVQAWMAYGLARLLEAQARSS